MKKIIAIILMTLMVVVFASGCGGNKGVAGTWQQEDDGERIIKVSDDGTYVYYRYGTDDDGYPGTWTSFNDEYYAFIGISSGLSSEGYIDEEGRLVITHDGGGKDTIGDYVFERK